MKGLMKIIGMILGILGLSAKGTAKKKAAVKKIDKQVKKVKKAKAEVQKKKPVKKPNVTSAKKARASLKRRAKR